HHDDGPVADAGGPVQRLRAGAHGRRRPEVLLSRRGPDPGSAVLDGTGAERRAVDVLQDGAADAAQVAVDVALGADAREHGLAGGRGDLDAHGAEGRDGGDPGLAVDLDVEALALQRAGRGAEALRAGREVAVV